MSPWKSACCQPKSRYPRWKTKPKRCVCKSTAKCNPNNPLSHTSLPRLIPQQPIIIPVWLHRNARQGKVKAKCVQVAGVDLGQNEEDGLICERGRVWDGGKEGRRYIKIDAGAIADQTEFIFNHCFFRRSIENKLCQMNSEPCSRLLVLLRINILQHIQQLQQQQQNSYMYTYGIDVDICSTDFL